MTITEYEIEMTGLMTNIADAVVSYSNRPLTSSEKNRYLEFTQAAIELMHEQNQPQGRPDSTTETMNAEHIKSVLGIIESRRLKRMFPVMAPELALRAADYIVRRGIDKRFW